MVAGIPNIEGTAGPFRSLFSQSGHTSLGALSVSNEIVVTMAANGDARDGFNRNVILDASRSNSIYGSSDTVTPLSLSTKFFIKY